MFAADELLHVLQGTLVLANPETGEVVRADRGESVFFRRDTWHHGFSHGAEDLRVLEFFAPPPATGTSGAYAQTRPYLTQSRYAAGDLDRRSFRVLREPDATWQLDLGVLVGLLVRTEHLTVGTLRVLPGQASDGDTHPGDELVYVTAGALRVVAGDADATLRAGDGFSIPAGVPHRYACDGTEIAEAVFGVAPRYRLES